jgi:heme/copper-type cytochrome/quinol oxidase subunit 2
MLNYKNKKAQMAETITWVVATIVIIFLLVLSVYFSTILGKGKSVDKEDINIYGESEDWILVKTSLAYENNVYNKDKINVWINEEDNNGA